MECMNTVDAIFTWIGMAAVTLLALLAVGWKLGYVVFGVEDSEGTDDTGPR